MNYDSTNEKLVPLTELADNLGIEKHVIKKDFDPDTFIKTEMIEVRKLFVDEGYQRFINKAMIKNQSEYDPTLASDLDVFLRPNGKYATADGQHGGVIGYLYTTDGGKLKVPCKVRKHPKDYTLEQCEEAESKFFLEKNKNRTSVSQLDKLRSGICYQDAESLATLDKLISMGVVLENVGAEDGIEVQGLSKIIESYSIGLEETKTAIDLYKSWTDDKSLANWKSGSLKGSFIGGLARAFVLVGTLGKGDKSYAFKKYVTENLGKRASMDTLHKGSTGSSQSHTIAMKIINRFNTLVDEGFIHKKDGSLLHSKHGQISDEQIKRAGIIDPTA